VLSLAPPHRFQQVLKKVRQPDLQPFQSLRLHAVKVSTLAHELKYQLT
jgi:hypothetical protein